MAASVLTANSYSFNFGACLFQKEPKGHLDVHRRKGQRRHDGQMDWTKTQNWWQGQSTHAKETNKGQHQSMWMEERAKGKLQDPECWSIPPSPPIQPHAHMPRRAWITEVRGLGGAGGAVGVWKADKGRQGQSQESKLCPGAQTGGADRGPLVWYDHLLVGLSVWSGPQWRDLVLKVDSSIVNLKNNSSVSPRMKPKDKIGHDITRFHKMFYLLAGWSQLGFHLREETINMD